MRSRFQKFGLPLAALIFSSVLAFSSAFAADKADTFTGQVSDAMCGAKHAMGGSDADCTRACVKKGSNYALVVGDKVYTLNTTDKAALDQLNKLAGENAKVTGTVKGDSVDVKSVSGA